MELGLPCVHCGLCLDTCPTYRVLGTEADSPRGRIYLMEAIRAGEASLDSAARGHLDGCLGCLACETACPSGVSFGRRIEEFRPRLAKRSGARSLLGDVLMRCSTDPRLIRFAQRTAKSFDAVGLGRLRRRIPGLGLLPANSVSVGLGDVSPLRRSVEHQPVVPRARVALLTGCVGDRLLAGINRDAVEVLQRNGIEVVEVEGQGCCGALALHSGHEDEAREVARRNVRAFGAAFAARDGEPPVAWVATTAAGCGAALREYAHLLRDDEALLPAAEALAERTRDVCELLVDYGFDAPEIAEDDRHAVAYHDACHLLHACKVERAPRLVCEAATGKAPVDLGENAICCGSAGSYNLTHPAMATQLGSRKAELVAHSGRHTVAVANGGCAMQIERSLALAGTRARVAHPVELLAEAYRRADGAHRTD